MKFAKFKIINKSSGRKPKNIIKAFCIASVIYQENVNELKKNLENNIYDCIHIFTEKYKFVIIKK